MSPKNLLRSSNGAVLPLVALMFLLLLIGVGVVVDIGRIYAVQSKAQNAADAALLGAVATRSTKPDVDAEMIALFNANYPADYMGGKVSNLHATAVDPSPQHFVYEADFTVSVPTLIMHIFGNTPTQPDNTDVKIVAQVSGGQDCANCNNEVELALVLDNTGSMGNTISGGSTPKMAALRIASKSLIDILFGTAATMDKVHVSVVPYDLVVQIGTGRASWIQDVHYTGAKPGDLPGESTPRDKYLKYQYDGKEPPGEKGFAMNRFTDFMCGPYLFPVFRPDDPGGCEPRCPANGQLESCNDYFHPETGKTDHVCTSTGCVPGTQHCYPPVPAHTEMWGDTTCPDNKLEDVSDTPPTAGDQWLFRPPYENTIFMWSDWGDSWTYPETLAPLLFASNNKAELLAELDSMKEGGDTRIPVGLMWGWFTLSPKWTGLWDGGKANFPQPFASNLNKSMVLMTDGVNDLHKEGGDGSDTLEDDKTAALCTAIKAQGITLYTIGFGSDGQYNKKLLQDCATRPTDFFEAPTTEQLQNVFHAIGDDINFSTLRLTK